MSDDSPNGEEHDVQSHIFRPTKYCGICYDMYLIQATSFVVAGSGHHLRILALNKVNIVAVTTTRVLHVGNGRSEHV